MKFGQPVQFSLPLCRTDSDEFSTPKDILRAESIIERG